ncbi:MAG TPA: hypothetical protein VFO39_11185 [Candidatus Sulfotelmatobacter sp.]|nr:hypothetical protein [Candidatus Sulfotelmatobacter sp.]
MTPEERERMAVLVARIQEEKNSSVFIRLVGELNDLIDRTSQNIGACFET